MLQPFNEKTYTLNSTHGVDKLFQTNLFTQFDELEAKDIVSCLKNMNSVSCYSHALKICSFSNTTDSNATKDRCVIDELNKHKISSGNYCLTKYASLRKEEFTYTKKCAKEGKDCQCKGRVIYGEVKKGMKAAEWIQ